MTKDLFKMSLDELDESYRKGTRGNRNMTNEEMEERWPDLPPLKARDVVFLGEGTSPESHQFEINQDTIAEIGEYLQAVKESMN